MTHSSWDVNTSDVDAITRVGLIIQKRSSFMQNG